MSGIVAGEVYIATEFLGFAPSSTAEMGDVYVARYLGEVVMLAEGEIDVVVDYVLKVIVVVVLALIVVNVALMILIDVVVEYV